jgi:acyl-CoA reductase-like NAD-dependent aldehyde dehydrogenase
MTVGQGTSSSVHAADEPRPQAVRPIYVAGDWVATDDLVPVHVPGRDGAPIAVTCHAGPAECERAIAAAVAAERPLAAMPAFERAAALRAIADGILARAPELARQLAGEAGKPIRDAATEIERGALTFRVAAEEAERIYGEVVPLDINAASRGRVGIVRRYPIGAVAAISPFNLPLGLAAHKVAPALAAGCPVVVKPPSSTPLTMLSVAEIAAGVGLPAGSLSVLPMTREVGDALVVDPRLKLLSFTGSPEVGWAMKARAGKKKVVLELGSNSAAIVDRSADLEWAVERCAYGAFKYAGQLCISVQRIVVHAAVLERFLEAFVARAAELRVGDPLDAGSDIGPLIDAGAAARVESWVAQAVAGGARVLLGGTAEGAFMGPTVLTDVDSAASIWAEEAFGPVAAVSSFEDFDDALAQVNDSRFGLQAGLFTNDLAHAWRAFDELHVGGVIVNDAPTYRVDNMPFGGVKDSGVGREGLRWAIEDMTEPRLLVLAGRT